MPKFALATNSVADQGNRAPTAERLINCYVVPAPMDARAEYYIRAVPGLRDFSSLGGPFLRTMGKVEGKLYVISSGRLWLISESGAVTELATITDDVNTSIAGHRSAVTITAGGAYSLYDGTLTQPESGRLSVFGSVDFLSQYTLLTELGGREVEWTEAGDPADRNGLYFRTAEGRDDNIIRGIVWGSYYFVMKERSIEVWSTTGLGGASAFRRIDGAVYDIGLKAFNLAARSPGGIFFISDKNTACVTNGGQPTAISPPQVNVALNEETPTHLFYYEDRGHQLHVIRFAHRPAWVYDAATSRWHERSSGTRHEPWDIVAAEFCYGQWFLGSRLGEVYKLGIGPWDADVPMRRTIVTPNFYVEGEMFSISELELLGDFGRYDIQETGPNWLTDQWGVPLTDQDGAYLYATQEEAAETIRRPGGLWVRFSRNGGNTFGLPKPRSFGLKGQYDARCRFTALGQYENMVAEINLTDPFDVPLLSEGNVVIS